MRYRPEHKAAVHQKIVKDASRRVRAEGLNGAAVAAVMRDTGLTHGGFYKHFENKDELLLESLREAFRDFGGTLVRVAEEAETEAPWRAIVKSYLTLKYCEHADRGCPLTALAPEMARADQSMRSQILSELVTYKNRLVPFMPGRGTADKEQAFFVIFSTMMGAVEIARLLPQRGGAQEKVLASTREFLLRSF
ncbi:MAG TPA: TetR/AcrR family transcriptional regulator [Terracidiphilus sp.]|jgi:TetR/AcrR family transcriptional repressor of nem operon|nr:TetR/AcrR family transcriptional regulator [Terracidiphilus sp.]